MRSTRVREEGKARKGSSLSRRILLLLRFPRAQRNAAFLLSATMIERTDPLPAAAYLQRRCDNRRRQAVARVMTRCEPREATALESDNARDSRGVDVFAWRMAGVGAAGHGGRERVEAQL